MAPFLTKYSKPECILGHVRELPRSYAKNLHEKLQQELKAIISECFPEFGIIFDGTPSFAEFFQNHID